MPASLTPFLSPCLKASTQLGAPDSPLSLINILGVLGPTWGIESKSGDALELEPNPLIFSVALCSPPGWLFPRQWPPISVSGSYSVTAQTCGSCTKRALPLYWVEAKGPQMGYLHLGSGGFSGRCVLTQERLCLPQHPPPSPASPRPWVPPVVSVTFPFFTQMTVFSLLIICISLYMHEPNAGFRPATTAGFHLLLAAGPPTPHSPPFNLSLQKSEPGLSSKPTVLPPTLLITECSDTFQRVPYTPPHSHLRFQLSSDTAWRQHSSLGQGLCPTSVPQEATYSEPQVQAPGPNPQAVAPRLWPPGYGPQAVTCAPSPG